jgi:hypothetical protein
MICSRSKEEYEKFLLEKNQVWLIKHILWQHGIFCDHLVYFSALVSCTKKNLATLLAVWLGPNT